MFCIIVYIKTSFIIYVFNVFLKHSFTFTWLSRLVNLTRFLFSLLWFSFKSFETKCTVTFVKSNFKIFSWDLLMIETAKFQIQNQFDFVLFSKSLYSFIQRQYKYSNYFVCGIWNLFMLSQNYLMITSFITNKTCL